MKSSESSIPVEVLETLIYLNEQTGFLYWKSRNVSMFRGDTREASRAAKIWNTRFAGKQAFLTKHGAGYLHGSINNQKFLAHRVVWAISNGSWPAESIDHINVVKTDNRPCNLRDVCHQENCFNQKRSKRNASGATGVSFDKSRDMYEAYVCPNGRKRTLGRFATFDEAVAARRVADSECGLHSNHGRNVK